MKFTELTIKEYENFVQNPSLESHYFQVKENIVTRENDGFQVVLLGIKDENNKVLAASLFSKYQQWVAMSIILIVALSWIIPILD